MAVLSLGAAGLVAVKYVSDSDFILDAHLQRARAHVQEVLLARRWNANYGGVYVEKHPGVISNPYLSNPDIETKDGRILTLRNPALMTRELSELAAKEGNYSFRLTGLKLINPANAPDNWERQAIAEFESSKKSEWFAYAESEEKQVFRYIAPVYIEPSCVKCHGFLGYKVGDLRGGLSVTFDVSGTQAMFQQKSLATAGAFILILLLVGGAIYRKSTGTSRQVKALHDDVNRQRLRFETLVHTTDGIVWEADATTFTFTFVSARAEAILGFPLDDWYQPGFWVSRLHPDDKSWAPEYCAASTTRMESHEFEYRLIAKDGRIVWVQDMVSVVSENGRAISLRGLMLDTTQRKVAESKNVQLMAEQKALLDNALVGIVHIRHRKVVSCNPRFEQLFAYQPGELAGQSTRVIYASDNEYEKIGHEAYAAIATGVGYSGEVQLRHKDESTFWGALTGKAIDPANPHEGSIWIYADISDRKQASDEANKLLRAVEQSPVSIVITNPSGFIEYVNPRFTAVTGYSRDEVLGQNPRVLQSGKTPPEVYRGLWDCILAGREWRGVLHNQRKNGEYFWEDASIAPVLNEDGVTTHYIAVKEDITERRKDEAELASYRASLESQVVERTQDLVLAMQKVTAADRAKGEFLTQMSHEIRTPMNAIIGFCRLLEKTPVTPQQFDYLNKIDGASQHLLELINNVLDLSKIAAKKIELDQREFSMKKLVTRLSSVIGQKANEKLLNLEIFLDDETPECLVGDSLRLNQILINLLTNAIKFTEVGSVSLKISRIAQEEGDPERNQLALLFSVEDSGIGISPEELRVIFEPFAQADASITRKYGGTGLGLPIARELVALLGGKLSVTSTKGSGSRFSFVLPFEKCTSVLPESPSSLSHSATPKRNYRFQDVDVLLVEDQILNQQVAVELLSAVGIRVHVANNGQEAVDILRDPDGQHFDLVLMDIQMPVLDGLSAMRMIRQTKTLIGLPLIAMTAHVLAEEQRQSLAAGANDHLGKPFNPDDLYALIANWVPLEKVSWTLAAVPAEKSLTKASAVIDSTGGLARFAGRDDKYRQWLKRFMDDRGDEVAGLRALHRSGSIEPLGRQVHSLKGLSGTLGLSEVYSACQAFEAEVRGGAMHPSIVDLLDQLEVVMLRAFSAIDDYLTADSAIQNSSECSTMLGASGSGSIETSPAAGSGQGVEPIALQLKRLLALLESADGDSLDWAESCVRAFEKKPCAIDGSDPDGDGPQWDLQMAAIVASVRRFDFSAASTDVKTLLDQIAAAGMGGEA